MATTREITRQVRLNEWKKVFQAKAESRLSAKAFCERNNISRDKYFYWLTQARKEELRQNGNQLVALPDPATLASELVAGSIASLGSVKLNINGVEITVDQNTTPAMLKMVIGVLKNAQRC